VALFRTKAELEALQPLQDALTDLHESVVGVATLTALLATEVERQKEHADGFERFSSSEEPSEMSFAASCFEKRRSSDLPRAATAVVERLTSTRNGLVRFMQQYGRSCILLLEMEVGVIQLRSVTETLLDDLGQHVGEMLRLPAPGVTGELAARLQQRLTFLNARAALGHEIGLWADDLSRELQNRVLGRIMGRTVPLRSCRSPEAMVLMGGGLKKAAEVGAPLLPKQEDTGTPTASA
jgi:hypothetical protein